ncbi:8212_t:CDS:1, partial [Funneliformis geosporum]
MEVEVTSTSSYQDKGKGLKQFTPTVKKTPIDLDQSFDAAKIITNKRILFNLN